jgi:hypothetical protein
VLSVAIHLLALLLLAQTVFLTSQQRGLKWIQVGFIEKEKPRSPEIVEEIPPEPEVPPEEPKVEPPEVLPVVGETPEKTIPVVEEPKSPEKPEPAKSGKGTDAPAPGPAPPEPLASPIGLGAGRIAGGEGQGTSDFRNRSGAGRGDALLRYGGNAASEKAVALGLAWLRRHQAPDGCWSGDAFDRRCFGWPCGDPGESGYEPGHTGLALLCFLGAGHTHVQGRYRRPVTKGLAWLLSSQTSEGRFGRPNRMYNHAIACLAIAEAYGMTGDERLVNPLATGMAYLVSAQQKGGGWDYVDFPTRRSDTSVTGFALMACKSARAVGVPLPAKCIEGMRNFFRAMTRSDGRVEYEDRGRVGQNRRRRYGPGMAAVGLLSHLYLGENPENPQVNEPVRRVLATPPSRKGLRRERMHSTYYWYYATLALFHLGGETWERWNGITRDLIVSLQRRDGCAAGSWDPEERWTWLRMAGGRLMATTMNILSLEVYYRYLPLYQGGSVLTPETQGKKNESLAEAFLAARKKSLKPSRNRKRKRISTAEETRKAREALARALADPKEAARIVQDPRRSSGHRIRAIRALEKAKGSFARDALIKALSDSNPAVRWASVKSLGVRGEKESLPALLEALQKGDDKILTTYLDAITRIGGKSALLAIIPHLSHPAERIRLHARRCLQNATGCDKGSDAAGWLECIAKLDD